MNRLSIGHSLLWFPLCVFAAASSLAQLPQPTPRLAGIINVAGMKRAILEGPPSRPWSDWDRHFILGEAQREGHLQVIAIHPESGSVELRLGGTNLIRLRLSEETNLPVAGIALEKADLYPVLRLYSECVDRTLLRSPKLPKLTLSLRAPATNLADVARVFEKAFSENGISTIPDGTRFMIVFPKEMAPKVKPMSNKFASTPPKPPGSGPASSDMLPAGAINFPQTDLNLVIIIYAELVGRKLDRSEAFRGPYSTITLQTQTPLSKEEAIYAFDTVFAFHGVKMVKVGDDLVRPVLLPEN